MHACVYMSRRSRARAQALSTQSAARRVETRGLGVFEKVARGWGRKQGYTKKERERGEGKRRFIHSTRPVQAETANPTASRPLSYTV